MLDGQYKIYIHIYFCLLNLHHTDTYSGAEIMNIRQIDFITQQLKFCLTSWVKSQLYGNSTTQQLMDI